MKNFVFQCARLAFGVTLIAFFAMGFVVVFTQLFGIFSGNPALVKSVSALLTDASAYVSTVCAFAGYLAYYTKPAKKKSA